MPTIWTIGHSTRSIDEFIALLKVNDIRAVADIRRHPGSRKFPHYNEAALSGFLSASQIDYRPVPELGGRRRARADSLNTVWRNVSFRGYADYMETGAFQLAVEHLERHAAAHPTALMCAEAVWWSCHRALLADFLTARGWVVQHILDVSKLQVHPYTSAARIVDGMLTYHETAPLF